MKRILITGAGSYIGTSFESYIKQWQDEYEAHTLDMVDGSWSAKSFAGYDIVFHVAGIAHIKETKENAYLYYAVNRDLAVEAARKAKEDGVKQFIFLSSMSVYGMETGVITRQTQPAPKTNYGRSKLEAEEGIAALADQNYLVAILRPPMVYGKACKGNFQALVKIAKKAPFFPNYKNERSMIFIDNLSSFIKMTIDQGISGTLYPCNDKPLRTDHMIRLIAKSMNKRILFCKCLAPFITLAMHVFPQARKAFGSLIYSGMPNFDYSYIVCDIDASIRKSV